MAMAVGAGSANDSSEGYAPTFYPGTVNVADAQPVTVGLGQELTIHIALAAARMARVSGSVSDSQGRPASGAMVMLRSGGGGGMFMTSMAGQVTGDGTFTLRNVSPGEYFVDVRPPGRGPGSAAEFASVPMTVANEDINGLRITTGPGATVRGRVIFAGTAPRTGGFGPLRVLTQGSDPQMPPMGFMLRGGEDDGTIADDGSFQLGNLSGKLLFRVSAPPAWALQSVTIDGEDVTDVPYDFKGAQRLSDVRIVLTDKLTEVSGSVTDERGRLLADYVVVLLPAEPKEGMAAMRFTRTVRPDQQGSYRVRGLPPGRYLIAALESLEQGREWDPEFQDRFRDLARGISLTEGQSASMDLRITSGL
jgi:protocatechuate 3,4-dioxygenase beta subunit